MILPTPGSVTAELFTLSEADFRNRFGKPLPRSPEPVPPESLSGFADRVFGNLLWLLPDGILVGARFPPFATRPEALTFACGWIAGRGGLLDRAAAVGLPQPDVDPAYVLGESGTGGVPLGRSLKYIPAPLNLAELTYTAFKQSNERVRVSIVAVMPDEPRRIELAQEWQKALPLARNRHDVLQGRCRDPVAARRAFPPQAHARCDDCCEPTWGAPAILFSRFPSHPMVASCNN
jgi:hypothetical protein